MRIRELIADPSLPRPAPLAARIPRLIGAPGDLTPLIRGLRVGIVGVGAVGRVLSVHLARQQISSLFIVDRGQYKRESLVTQAINPDEVGLPKASSAGRVCSQISPATRLRVFDGPVQQLPPTAFSALDYLLLASDNLATEVFVGQLALHLGLPLLQASVDGATLVAQVRFFGNQHPSASPCPACLFGSAEWAHLSLETRFSCESYFAAEADSPRAVIDTRSFSFVCSLAANLAAIQLLRHATKLGPPVADTMLEYCGFTHRTVISPLRANAACLCDHQRWSRRAAPRLLADCTPGELFSLLGGAAAAGHGYSLEVGGYRYVERGICPACRSHQRIRRFSKSLHALGTCRKCGGQVGSLPFFAYRAVPLDLLAGGLAVPLNRQGVHRPGYAILRGPRGAILLEDRESEPETPPQSAQQGGARPS